jgi:hypothetical protein
MDEKKLAITIALLILVGIIVVIVIYNAYERGNIKFIERRKIKKRYYERLYDGPTITYKIFKDLYG